MATKKVHPAAGSPAAYAVESTYELLNSVVRNNDITAEEALEADLLEGEDITRTFDVFFPQGRLEPWRFWLYTICTLGCYALCWNIAQWCYAIKCCVPRKVEMIRGRMALTSRGRLLVWRTHVVQDRVDVSACSKLLCCLCKCIWKEACAPPVKYQSQTQTTAFVASQIVDVELRSVAKRSVLCGWCCCGEQFDAAVRVRFGTFRDDDKARGLFGDTGGGSVSTRSAQTYADKIRALFGGVREFPNTEVRHAPLS